MSVPRLSYRAVRMIRRTRAGLLTADGAIVVMLLAAGAMVSMYRLGASSLWVDEGVTWAASTTLPGRLLYWIQSHEVNMLAFYLLVAGFERLVGLGGAQVTEFVLRFPNAVAHPLAAAALYWVGRRRIGTLPALAAALAFLLMPGAVGLARNARSYSLQTLGVILSWHAWMAIVVDRRSGRRWAAMYALAVIFAAYMQLVTLVMVACQVATAGLLAATVPDLRAHLRSQLAPAAAALGAAGLATAPLVALEAAFPNRTAWVPGPSQAAAGAVAGIAAGSLPFLGLVAAGLALWAGTLYLGRRDAMAPFRWSVGAWALGAPALTALISALPHSVHLFFPRYLAMCLPGAALAVGMAVRSLGSVATAASVVAVLVLVGSGALAAAGTVSQPPREEYRSAVAWVGARWRPGDVAIVSPDDSLPAILFYSARHPGPRRADLENPDAAPSLGAAHPRVFVIVGPTTGGELGDGIDPALRASRLRISDSASFAASYGPTRVALYTR